MVENSSLYLFNYSIADLLCRSVTVNGMVVASSDVKWSEVGSNKMLSSHIDH